MVFFNSAVVSCAVLRMRGEDPTVRDGLRAAFDRTHLILGWALVSATVSTVLRIIEDNSSLAGRIIAGIIGMAWGVVTFLAVPVMVVERTGPIESFKRSTALLRETWGEQIVGRFSFGLLFMALGFPAVIPIVLGAMSGSTLGAVLGIGLGGLYLVLLALVESVLHAIFRAALYVYATEGDAPVGFSPVLLNGAMGPRESGGLTG